MNIKIKEPDLCKSCCNKSCGYLPIGSVSHHFQGLCSESAICPQSVIDSMGPSDDDLNRRDIRSRKGKKCIRCGLCVRHCSQQNLQLVNEKDKADFGDLSAVELKAVTSSYFSLLFGFAANSNRNTSLPFDIYVQTTAGEEAFVQIDFADDSLESLRRVVGDIILYSDSHQISTGIIVLSNLPTESSHAVFDVLTKIADFPTMRTLRFYMTTFDILREFCLKTKTPFSTFESVCLQVGAETTLNYTRRVCSFLNGDTP